MSAVKASADGAPEAPGEAGPADKPATVADAGRTTAQYRDIADKLRGRVDTLGKTFGALATTGATAIGLAKIGDLFPLPKGDDYKAWAYAAIGGFALGALAVVYLATRLSKVSRPLYVRSDVEGMERDREISGKERRRIEPLFERTARLNGAQSLVGYERRGAALRRTARWTRHEDERARREARADEVRADVEQTLARAAVIVIRRRAAKALTGFGAWAAYVAFVAGLVLFALGTDKVASGRVDPATAKACADARSAGATPEELGPPCSKTSAGAGGDTASEGQVRVTIAEQALAALKTCEDAVKAGTLETADCQGLRGAVGAAVAP